MNVLCLIRDGGNVLLTRSAAFPNRWNAVAGSVARGESHAEAASRKTLEETKLVVPVESWRVVEETPTYVCLACEHDCKGAVAVSEPIRMCSLKTNWKREPLAPNLPRLIPEAFK